MPWRDSQEPLAVKIHIHPLTMRKQDFLMPQSPFKKLCVSNPAQCARWNPSAELGPVMGPSTFYWALQMIHWWACSLTPTEQMGAADVWRKWDKEREQKARGNIRIHPVAQWTAFQREVVLRSCTTKRQMVSMAPHVSEPPSPLQFWFFQGASSNYSQSEPQDVNNPHDCSSQWMSLNNHLKEKTRVTYFQLSEHVTCEIFAINFHFCI